MAILVLPPILAAYLASTSHQFPNPFESFWAFACGLSGMFAFGVVRKLVDGGSETICTALSIAFVASALVVFVCCFKREGIRNIVLIAINAFVSAWSVLFGFIWQYAVNR